MVWSIVVFDKKEAELLWANNQNEQDTTDSKLLVVFVCNEVIDKMIGSEDNIVCSHVNNVHVCCVDIDVRVCVPYK